PTSEPTSSISRVRARVPGPDGAADGRKPEIRQGHRFRAIERDPETGGWTVGRARAADEVLIRLADERKRNWNVLPGPRVELVQLARALLDGLVADPGPHLRKHVPIQVAGVEPHLHFAVLVRRLCPRTV